MNAYVLKGIEMLDGMSDIISWRKSETWMAPN